jgi:hypothetical protein
MTGLDWIRTISMLVLTGSAGRCSWMYNRIAMSTNANAMLAPNTIADEYGWKNIL